VDALGEVFEDSIEVLEQAFAALDRGDREAFRANLEMAARLGSPQAHYNLGVLEQETERHAEAIERFTTALSMDDGYHAARLELARMYGEGWGVPRDVPRALHMMERVASEDDGRLGGLASLNIVLLALHHRDETFNREQLRGHFGRAKAAGHDLEPLRDRLADVDEWEHPPPWAALEPTPRARVLKRFGGSWTLRHTMPLWDLDENGKEAWIDVPVQSCVAVLPGADEAIAVEINTTGVNHHHCILDARGGVNARGELVAQSDHPFVLLLHRHTLEGPRCWFRFELSRQGLHLAEVWPSECAANPDWCGARGQMEGYRFEHRIVGGRCDYYDEIRNRTTSLSAE
jgi:hypothetical protein